VTYFNDDEINPTLVLCEIINITIDWKIEQLQRYCEKFVRQIITLENVPYWLVATSTEQRESFREIKHFCLCFVASNYAPIMASPITKDVLKPHTELVWEVAQALSTHKLLDVGPIPTIITNNIIDDILPLLNQDPNNPNSLYDLQFIVSTKEDQRRFYAHQCIVGSRSQILLNMLNSGMIEARTQTIQLPEIQSKIFYIFLCYLYGEDIARLSINEIADLWIIASQYMVFTLANICEHMLMQYIDLTNVMDILIWACNVNMERIIPRCLEMVIENFRILDDPAILDNIVKNCPAVFKDILLLFFKKKMPAHPPLLKYGSNIV